MTGQRHLVEQRVCILRRTTQSVQQSACCTVGPTTHLYACSMLYSKDKMCSHIMQSGPITKAVHFQYTASLQPLKIKLTAFSEMFR